MNSHRDHEHHDHGLAHDLDVLIRQSNRRRALSFLGGGAALALSGAARAACTLIPEETAGPYPGDGSNSASGGIANALMLSGIVRRDIRSSVGGATGTAPGLQMSMRIALVNTNASCARLSGYAIYLWHCTRNGLYSMYSSGVTNQNYLRGVQVTDEDGVATFTTVFPGCYAGRMPHMHLEVYRSVTTATSFSNKLRTSQIAFPVSICQRVYNNAEGYEQSVNNLANISFATDNVFSDGYATQLAAVSSSASAGLSASLQIGIAV